MKGPYGNQFLKQQKEKLLKLKLELLNKTKSIEDISAPEGQTSEEGDLAQIIIGQNVSFELKERELKRLKQIDMALEKIEFGNYGICDETDEPIEIHRLEKMPWANLCIQAQEDQERLLRTRGTLY